MRFVAHVVGVLLCIPPLFAAGILAGLPWKPGTSYASDWYYVWGKEEVTALALAGVAFAVALLLWIALAGLVRPRGAPALGAPPVRLRRALAFGAITVLTVENAAIVASLFASSSAVKVDEATFAKVRMASLVLCAIGLVGIVTWVLAARTIVRWARTPMTTDLGPLRRVLLAVVVLMATGVAMLASFANLRGGSLGFALSLCLSVAGPICWFLLRSFFGAKKKAR